MPNADCDALESYIQRVHASCDERLGVNLQPMAHHHMECELMGSSLKDVEESMHYMRIVGSICSRMQNLITEACPSKQVGHMKPQHPKVPAKANPLFLHNNLRSCVYVYIYI